MTKLWMDGSGNLLWLPGSPGTLMSDDTDCCCVDCDTDGPTASFTWAPAGGCSIDFTDTSTAGTSSIVSWSWSFGDSTSSTEQNPTHAYVTVTSYTVYLTVTDENGCTDTTSASVTVLCCGKCAGTDSETVSITASGFVGSGSICDAWPDLNGTHVLDRVPGTLCKYSICFEGTSCRMGIFLDLGAGVDYFDVYVYGGADAGCTFGAPLYVRYRGYHTTGDCTGTHTATANYTSGNITYPTTISVTL